MAQLKIQFQPGANSDYQRIYGFLAEIADDFTALQAQFNQLRTDFSGHTHGGVTAGGANTAAASTTAAAVTIKTTR